MPEWLKIVLTNASLPLVVSLITAVITAKITLKLESKRKIYERRENSYIKCFDLLQKIKDNPFLVFNWEYVSSLNELRTELNLFASQSVINILNPFYEKVKTISSRYWELFDGEQYESQKMGRMEHEGLTELDFEREEQLYQEDNVIDNETICQTMQALVEVMRKDMGNK